MTHPITEPSDTVTTAQPEWDSVDADTLLSTTIKDLTQLTASLGMPVYAYRRQLDFDCVTHDAAVFDEKAWTLRGWVNAQVCATGQGCPFAHDSCCQQIDGKNPIESGSGEDDGEPVTVIHIDVQYCTSSWSSRQ